MRDRNLDRECYGILIPEFLPLVGNLALLIYRDNIFSSLCKVLTFPFIMKTSRDTTITLGFRLYDFRLYDLDW